ncbi:hypothetical protein IW138_005747 [Coemansia sp. RSA 986]|nr:hypothetical protein IW138_005747 [Coemansia sp. RSA 986]
MSRDAASTRPSDLVRRIRKGEAQLTSTRGRLRIDTYTQAIGALGWRDLGVLLAQLTQVLDFDQTTAEHRCVAALAATVLHMHNISDGTGKERLSGDLEMEGTMSQVNSKFVTLMFGTMVRSCAKICSTDSSVVYPVVRCIARSLRGTPARSSQSTVFDPDAVFAGIAPTGTSYPVGSNKRRCITTGIDDLALVLACALESDSTLVAASRCAIRILRANESYVIRRLVPEDSITSTKVVSDLCRALVLQGCDAIRDPSEGAAQLDMSDLFACIRDTVPLVPASAGDASLELLARSVARLVELLAKNIFRPLLVAPDTDSAMPPGIYQECARSRVRCYQWAALCRMTTWLTLTRKEDDAINTAAVAEGGRMCWLQILLSGPDGDPTSPEASATAPSSIWLLLLSESLAQVACVYPQKQQTPSRLQQRQKPHALFLQTEDSQIRVFTVVASLLAVLPQEMAGLNAEKKNPSVLPLLHSCVGLCERLLLLIRPRAASMGLFWLHGTTATTTRRQPGDSSNPDQDDDEDDGLFDSRITTPVEYVFNTQQTPADKRKKPALSDAGRAAKSDDDMVRMVSEESVHESRIAGVFSGLDITVRTVLASRIEHTNGRHLRPLMVLCARTTLLWMRMFASGARSNVGRQMRMLENLPSSSIWMNSDRIILHKPATDWARLQRIPVAFNRRQAGNEQPDTFRPMVARVLRLLMALAAWPFLSDAREQTIVRCLQTASSAGDGSDSPHNGDFDEDGQQAYAQCQHLASLVSSSRELRALAFAALQVLASIIGVRLHLFSSGDPSELRPPHVQVRDRTPPSSEALIHLAMQLGACKMLLHPQLLANAIDALDPVNKTSISSDSKAFVPLQMWLDIVGAVVRHSFFRSFLGPASFQRWWCLALAASVRSIANGCKQPDLTADRLRMALIVPTHLASWQQYLSTSGAAIAGFTQLAPLPPTDDTVDEAAYWDSRLFGWLKSLDSLLLPGVTAAPGSSSIIYIVYFCACKLWLSVPLLDNTPSEGERPMVYRICRDIWGIAAEMLHLLMRMLQQHSAVHRSFVSSRSRLVEDFSTILVTLTAGREKFPCVVADIVASNSDSQLSVQNAIDDEDGSGLSSDLITIPLFDPDPANADPANTDPSMASYTTSNEKDHDDPAHNDVVDDSVVGRLLRQTTDQSATGPTKYRQEATALDEYYSKQMLAALWSSYTDKLQQFPCSLMFSRTIETSRPPLANEGSIYYCNVDMAQWLDDPDNVLRRLFVPLLAVQHRLSHHPAALWAAVTQRFPTQSILRTMKTASVQQPPAAFFRMSVSAAFLLPPSLSTKDDYLGTVSAMLECLAAHHLLADGKGGEENGGSVHDALLFLAWRHWDAVLRNINVCARRLDAAADLAVSRLSEALCTAGMDAPRVVALNGHNIDATTQAPVFVPLDFLVKQSDVFRAMLTGPFREAEAVRRNCPDQTLIVQSDHATLADLFSIVRMTRSGQSHLISARLESSYSMEGLAKILHLAVFYDFRFLVVLLLWFVIDRAGRGHTPFASECGELGWLLSVLYRDNNAVSTAFDGLDDALAAAAVRALGAVVLLCSDTIDTNVELLVHTLRFVLIDSE